MRIVARGHNRIGARAKTREEHEACVSGPLARLYSDYIVNEYGR